MSSVIQQHHSSLILYCKHPPYDGQLYNQGSNKAAAAYVINQLREGEGAITRLYLFALSFSFP